MGRIGCCLFLGAAAVMFCGVPATAKSPAGSFSIAIVSFGQTDPNGAAPALAEAKRALAENLRDFGARVTGHVIAGSQESFKVRQAIAAGFPTTRARPADVVIGLTAKTVRRAGAYTAHVTISLEAVLHAVGSNATPRIFHMRRERRLHDSCAKTCLERIGARMAGEQARALAPDIFRWASRFVSNAARRLAFRGFSRRELGDIREYLRVFPGFEKMGPPAQAAKDSVIAYRSRLDDRALEAALAKMLGHMGIAAGISRRGRGFSVVRDTAPVHPDAASRQW